VARKSKIETEKQANGQGPEPAARDMAASTAAGLKTVDAGSRSKAKKSAPKKKTVRAIKSSAPKNTASSASIHEPSDDEIRIRAYFISERRIQLSLQGDSDRDWIEARRQLVEEAKRTAS
jgi:hypothetical protein